MTIWTQRLADAATAVAADKSELPYREALLRDIKSRAREFRQQSIGREMSRHEIEYFQCLRSRLENLPSHNELQAAWREAY